MAATVFNQARAWSKKLSSGKIVYVWEENTHCIKDGPKHAEWCAMKFGDKNQILERIYRMAQSIPGGMLKVGGRSPQKFVSDMIAVLSKPLPLTIEKVNLENSEKGFYAVIHNDNRDAAHALLCSLRRNDLATLVGTGTKPAQANLELDIDADYEVIDALLNHIRFKDGFYGEACGIPAWKVFHFGYRSVNAGDAEKEEISISKPKHKPVINFYQSALNIDYPGTGENEYFNVVTMDGKVVFGDRNGYILEGKLIEIACDIHVNNGTFVLGDMLNGLAASKADPLILSNNCVLGFELTEPSKWYGSIFKEVASVITGAACDSFSAKIADFIGQPETFKIREFSNGIASGYVKLSVDFLPQSQTSLFEV